MPGAASDKPEQITSVIQSAEHRFSAAVGHGKNYMGCDILMPVEVLFLLEYLTG